ncbi:substrate-binding periplasmic protein [Pseudodesulfovibrio piezophilus]|uniref:Uncharacterized protein n=1 Tax=Pseudodesulfovibrio piezophilus (strain DSM 21447 / JCM 15486 / C1TLV30) TaxID=1322246 RepID=M1WTH3_PSEP2|nr:transporter substrate-binding domain-containing protein [Pseudodesulfovibrio piezophilus]CCH49582.1 conserved exported protein of unknown function [Pseudodesulfovibrio piezophilus C1TLV30]
MKRVFVCLLLFAILLPVPGMALTPMRVSTSIKPPFSTHDQTGFFDLLILELGRRIEREIEFIRLPPGRALVSANDGKCDMELPRIGGLQTEYPNLIQIPEKVIEYQFVAFSRTGKGFSCWEALRNRRVGYLLGWKIFEKNVPDSVGVTHLRNPDIMFHMLDQGRIDVALYELYAGKAKLRELGTHGIKVCCPPLAVRPMYIYLHKSQAYLSSRIANCLKAMKADGTYLRILHQALGQ